MVTIGEWGDMATSGGWRDTWLLVVGGLTHAYKWWLA
jgi:hypothetical protein